MKKLSTLAMAAALTLAGTAALADDNSMSRFGGESYKAFEAANVQGPATLAPPESRKLQAVADNSMSPWNGESYRAFAEATKDSGTMSVASLRRPTPEQAERPHIARLHGRTPTNPFKDGTA